MGIGGPFVVLVWPTFVYIGINFNSPAGYEDGIELAALSLVLGLLTLDQASQWCLGGCDHEGMR